MKAILKKLYSSNKRSTSVKTELREVKLSTIEDIESQLADDKEYFEEKVKEITRLIFDAQNIVSELRIVQESKIAGLIYDKNELLNKVLDLGIEVPDRLTNLDDQLERLNQMPEIADVGDKLETLQDELRIYID